MSRAMPAETFSEDEQAWVMRGLAWVGLYRWRYGTAEGERARAWWEEQMDLRFGAKTAARHIGPGMDSLEAAARAVLTDGPDIHLYRRGGLVCPGSALDRPAMAPARPF